MKTEKRQAPQRFQQHRRASAGPIVFKTNTIFQDNEGKTVFLEAGKLSPFLDISDVPAKLQPHVDSSIQVEEESDEPRGMFELGARVRKRTLVNEKRRAKRKAKEREKE